MSKRKAFYQNVELFNQYRNKAGETKWDVTYKTLVVEYFLVLNIFGVHLNSENNHNRDATAMKLTKPNHYQDFINLSFISINFYIYK